MRRHPRHGDPTLLFAQLANVVVGVIGDDIGPCPLGDLGLEPRIMLEHVNPHILTVYRLTAFRARVHNLFAFTFESTEFPR